MKDKLQSENNNSSANKFVAGTQIRYDILVEENEAGIFYLNNDIITYANTAFAKVLGIERTALVGTSILDCMKGKDLQIFQDGFEKIRFGQEDRFSRDLQLKRGQEEDIYFSLHLKVYSRQEGMVEIIGASRDATIRVRRNKELSKMRSRFEALYHKMVDGIIIYDYIQEKVIDFNDAALSILGYNDPKDLLKLNRFDIIPKTSPYFPGIDLHAITKNHGLRVVDGEAFNTPGILNGNKGKQILANMNVVPTFHKPGEAFVIFHNTTSKVLAEEEKQKSDKRYRDIFENSHEGIIYTNVKTGIPDICNHNALSFFGVNSHEELASLRPQDFYSDSLVDGLRPQEHYDQSVNEALEKGRSELSIWLKKQTGEIIRIAGVLVSDSSDPENPKVISFLRDITYLHQTRVALNEKNEELKKYIDSNLQLENFAYFASHDLQTPLRSTISFTQLLKRKLDGRLSEEEEEYMEYIIRSSKNMRNLINDLLSFSRANTTKINLTKTPLKKILFELGAELDKSVPEKDAKIFLHKLPEYIDADPTKIRQIFQNLLSNAVKFANPDTLLEINIRYKETDDHWLFSVQDNGIGIEPEFHDKIFLLFKRLHTNAEYSGTGIGLAMVKKLVEQHGGEIGLESEIGQGTTFWFTVKKIITSPSTLLA